MQRAYGETVWRRRGSWGEIDCLNFWGCFKERNGVELGGWNVRS
jgi:hypothetical protein